MTAYEFGFISKCAELGVPSRERDLLLKRAFTRDDALYRIRASRDNVAQAEGLDVKDEGLPGTWVGRTIRRPFMSPEAFAKYYDTHTAGKVRDARVASPGVDGGSDNVQVYGNYGHVWNAPGSETGLQMDRPGVYDGTGSAQPVPSTPQSFTQGGQGKLNGFNKGPGYLSSSLPGQQSPAYHPPAEELSGSALSNANDQEARSAAFSSGLASGDLDTSYLPSRHFNPR